jgi:alkanesulfonate monooxygenase SsuD/methylene tetrahydromethanopterin reductase-like flavin-dependent oxidoreductase (luciferase family)
MTGLYFGADEAALETRLSPLKQNPQFADASIEDIVERLGSRGAVAGTPDTVTAQLKAFEQAGVTEIMLQWLDLGDLDGLEGVAAALL